MRYSLGAVFWGKKKKTFNSFPTQSRKVFGLEGKIKTPTLLIYMETKHNVSMQHNVNKDMYKINYYR